MPLVTVTAANFKLIFRLKRRDYKIYQLCNTKQQMDCEAKLFQFMPQSWSFQFSTEIKGKNQEKPGFFLSVHLLDIFSHSSLIWFDCTFRTFIL